MRIQQKNNKMNNIKKQTGCSSLFLKNSIALKIPVQKEELLLIIIQKEKKIMKSGRLMSMTDL